MKRKSLTFLILTLSFFLLLTVTAAADTGPKPSVRLEFQDYEGADYYVTLLSEKEGTGPLAIGDRLDSDPENSYGIDREIFEIFSEYQDSDGFYLLPYIKRCNGEFTFGYYPPSTFKILIYFPDKNIFAVSKIYERYAFDSYFTVSLKAVNLDSSNDVPISADERHILSIESAIDNAVRQSYDFSSEIKMLIARIIITFAIEIFIAYLFKLTEGKALAILLITNTVTQIILNLLLNVYAFYRGNGSGYHTYYVTLEVAVFIVESLVYTLTVPRFYKNHGRRYLILYAFVANLISYLVGLKVAEVLPNLF